MIITKVQDCFLWVLNIMNTKRMGQSSIMNIIMISGITTFIWLNKQPKKRGADAVCIFVVNRAVVRYIRITFALCGICNVDSKAGGD